MKLGEIIDEQHEYFNKELGKKKKTVIAQVYNNCSEKYTRGNQRHFSDKEERLSDMDDRIMETTQ